MSRQHTRPVELIPQRGQCDVAAVGESYYVEAFEAICGPRTDGGEHRDVVATILREPTNPYDSNAVGVYVDGRKVGHLSRAHALLYRSLIEAIEARSHTAACAAVIRGGWERGEGDITEFGSISRLGRARSLMRST